MKSVYPAVFTESEGVILVEVPDFNIFTEGKNIHDAICMARDAIGLSGISMCDHHEELPAPSDISSVDTGSCSFSGQGRSIVSLVDIDFDAYRKKLDMKSVRRNVTLPNWLNKMAEEAHINVSRVLQEALMEKLG